jgi:hypothetical protein
MLRKMYLVSQEYLNKSKQQTPPTYKTKMPPPKKRAIKRKTEKPQTAHDKWFRMRNRMREADITRKSLILTIADFVQKILPSSAPLVRGAPKFESQQFTPPHQKPSRLPYVLSIPCPPLPHHRPLHAKLFMRRRLNHRCIQVKYRKRKM